MKALILVDLQNDFLPGGALAVPNGNEVIPPTQKLLQHRARLFDLVVATQDWHPADHGSFASQHPGTKPGQLGELSGLPQVYWPDHCVQNSTGAKFAANLDMSAVDRIFQKGTDPALDSYSGFFDNAKRKSTGLGDYLKEKQVDHVYVLGLATDYCVKFTVLDALELGFRVSLVRDAVRAVNLHPEDGEKAIAEMKAAGAQVVSSAELLAS